MENKNVGWLLLGVSILIIGLVFVFNNTVMGAVQNSCFIQHGDVKSCDMYDTVNEQTYFALAIVGVLVVVSIFLIFSKERVIVKKVKEKKQVKHIDLSSYRPVEKQVYNIIKEHNAIFQADLIEKTGLTKATMTRIIDKLEGHGLVERKRRGMTNVVILKEE